MRKLAVLTFTTLDGVMQAPSSPDEDKSGDFTHGGWARPCWEEVMTQVMAEAMAEPYDLLLGRKTYDIFAASFPKSENPVADKLNAATKYVVTSNPQDLEWQNSVAISKDIPSEIATVKNLEGPLLQVHGSWQLIQTLLKHDLIDEFRLWCFPVIVGGGKRLFGSETVPAKLTLTKSATTPSGAVMCIYTNARK